jgi:hypothetical protein
MPKFKKGQSGNPGGRPQGRTEFARLARKHAPECLERLMHWVRSTKGAASVRAAQLVLERAFGPSPTAEEAAMISGDEGKTSTFGVVFVKPKEQAD